MEPRKIIHLDMDCFYAAIEIRDQPQLRGKPVAVGGKPGQRGVLCTCNYQARSFGVRSAMPTGLALNLCPELIVISPHMQKYKAISKDIHNILRHYSDCIEPIALDEAYLDVSHSTEHRGSATQIAVDIRHAIYQQHHLHASAGVATNKFLAKIASDWRKPNGQFVIPPAAIDEFVKQLPVKKIIGVGKVMQQKLAYLGIQTCADLQQWPLAQLIQRFGRMGARLYELARGIDKRAVESERFRKSVSVEHTFLQDLPDLKACLTKIEPLYQDLERRLALTKQTRICKQFVKIKFFDFHQTSVEQSCRQLNLQGFVDLLATGYQRAPKPVRLLGLGVGFSENKAVQLALSGLGLS